MSKIISGIYVTEDRDTSNTIDVIGVFVEHPNGENQRGFELVFDDGLSFFEFDEQGEQIDSKFLQKDIAIHVVKKLYEGMLQRGWL